MKFKVGFWCNNITTEVTSNNSATIITKIPGYIGSFGAVCFCGIYKSIGNIRQI